MAKPPDFGINFYLKNSGMDSAARTRREFEVKMKSL
jgi:hypothetical protein